MLAEWHPDPPRSLTLRTTTQSAGRAVETVAHLSLDREDDRRLVARWALAQTAPAFLQVAADDIARRLKARGTVERFTYADDESDDGVDLSAKAVVGAGYDRHTLLVKRRLVGAEVMDGDGTATRFDCLDPA